MGVQKAEPEAEDESDGRIKDDFAQADGNVFEAQAEVEAGSFKLADEDETVDTRIEQENLVEDGQVWRPGAFKPAQVDGEAERDEDEKVMPGAALIGIGAGSLPEQRGDGDGKGSVEGEPFPAKEAGAERDENVGDGKECGRGELGPER